MRIEQDAAPRLDALGDGMGENEFWFSNPEDCAALAPLPACAGAGLPSQNAGAVPGTEFARKCGMALQTLSIYGAAGITSFGWALSRLLHFECHRYLPLWFCSALFIYNLDRLKTDPADLINIPARSESAANLRRASRLVAAASAAALVLVPALERDWLMLLLTTGGALVCVNYSVPMLGFRLKDVPFLKSFFAPTLVTASFIIPPLLEQPHQPGIACCIMVAAWTWCVTLFNMLLCDLRDIGGDAETGIRSLPVAIGRRGTVVTLVLLLLLGMALSAAVRPGPGAGVAASWTLLSMLMPAYLAGLLAALRGPVTENFYEWWVEGILLVPAFACAVTSWKIA